MNVLLKLILLGGVIILVAPGVLASSLIPSGFALSDNYYTVTGGPELKALIVGDNEYERGDEITLMLDIYNTGKVIEFESEKTPTTAEELALAQIEKAYESGVTTSIGVVATLKNPNGAPVDIKSATSSIGSIRSGEVSSAPAEFDLKIDDNAPAGTYTLLLNLSYDYQKNVQVSGDMVKIAGQDVIVDEEEHFWYDTVYTEIPISIEVKAQPFFEVVNVSGELVPGKKSLVYVTFKNTGELTAWEATARITMVDPFSSTDDQAFLGDIKPGETAVGVFNVKVDDAATAKNYAIDSEIKYKDDGGEVTISDVVKVPVTVVAKEKMSMLGIGIGIVLIGFMFVGTVIMVRKRRMREKLDKGL
ncbi:MAG: COG1361 S-layer family protein [Methermicoccaceae archaeon]